MQNMKIIIEGAGEVGPHLAKMLSNEAKKKRKSFFILIVYYG